MGGINSRLFHQRDSTIKILVTCKKCNTEKIMHLDLDSIMLYFRCYSDFSVKNNSIDKSDISRYYISLMDVAQNLIFIT